MLEPRPDEAPLPPEERRVPWTVFPLGAALWSLGAWSLLGGVPAESRGKAFGLVLFILPLAMAILAALVGLVARAGPSERIRARAHLLVLALLWPFVAWGQWDSRRRH